MAMNNITLTSGMRSNLFSLQQTQTLMETTQTRLSTGKKVNSALDDPINFFAAQGHTQRAGDLAMRKDEMSEAIQTIKAADNGISAITDMIASAKSLAQSALATNDVAEREALADQYDVMLTQIGELVDDSGYKGTNLLDASQSITVSFNENGTSVLDVDGQDEHEADEDHATEHDVGERHQHDGPDEQEQRSPADADPGHHVENSPRHQ